MNTLLMSRQTKSMGTKLGKVCFMEAKCQGHGSRTYSASTRLDSRTFSSSMGRDPPARRRIISQDAATRDAIQIVSTGRLQVCVFPFGGPPPVPPSIPSFHSPVGWKDVWHSSPALKSHLSLMCLAKCIALFCPSAGLW